MAYAAIHEADKLFIYVVVSVVIVVVDVVFVVDDDVVVVAAVVVWPVWQLMLNIRRQPRLLMRPFMKLKRYSHMFWI